MWLFSIPIFSKQKIKEKEFIKEDPYEDERHKSDEDDDIIELTDEIIR